MGFGTGKTAKCLIMVDSLWRVVRPSVKDRIKGLEEENV